MSILVTTQKTKGISEEEDTSLPKANGQTKEREFKPQDSRIRDSDKESDDLGLSLPAVKTTGEFKEN